MPTLIQQDDEDSAPGPHVQFFVGVSVAIAVELVAAVLLFVVLA